MGKTTLCGNQLWLRAENVICKDSKDDFLGVFLMSDNVLKNGSYVAFTLKRQDGGGKICLRVNHSRLKTGCGYNFVAKEMLYLHDTLTFKCNISYFSAPILEREITSAVDNAQLFQLH